MGVTIDHDAPRRPDNAVPVAQLREKPVGRLKGFGIYLDKKPFLYHEVDKGIDQFTIPFLVLDSGTEQRCVMTNLVKMTDDIKTSRLYHGNRLPVKEFHHMTDIIIEIPRHLSLERLKTAVDIHISFIRRDKMHRANAIIERHILKTGHRRTPLIAKIVNFHRRIQIYTVAVHSS